ncbi:MAG: hypothetical protein PHT02_10740 [Tissierellia bacterium]|nr:hypothetical protein [Tissierellia bacterium]
MDNGDGSDGQRVDNGDGSYWQFLPTRSVLVGYSLICCQKEPSPLAFLNEKGVALNPGESFGAEWKNYVRISYCCSMEDVIEAMDLIKEYIESKIFS